MRLLLIVMLLPKYVVVESDVVPQFDAVVEGVVAESNVVAEFFMRLLFKLFLFVLIY